MVCGPKDVPKRAEVTKAGYPGGEAWFRALYDDPCFYCYVVDTAARCTRDLDLREDCQQEAWLAIWAAGPIHCRADYQSMARRAINACRERWQHHGRREKRMLQIARQFYRPT